MSVAVTPLPKSSMRPRVSDVVVLGSRGLTGQSRILLATSPKHAPGAQSSALIGATKRKAGSRNGEIMMRDDGTSIAGGRTGQLPVELILLRQVSSYLEMPIFLVDAEGRLVYFNEPAEPLLGSRFDEVGEMSMEDWLAAFRPSRPRGRRLPREDVPLVIALTSQRPVHATLEITGLDGARRPIEATALPLRGPHGRLLGAIAIFWPVH